MSSVAQVMRGRHRWGAFGIASGVLGLVAGIALIGLLIVVFFWCIGARFSIDGAAWIGSWLAGFIGAPWSIPTPLAWDWYVRLVFIPLSMSAVEFGVPLVARVFPLGRQITAALFAIWSVTVILDLFTTYVGTGVVAPGAGEVAQRFAANPPARAVATVALTFLPELILSALIMLALLALGRWVDVAKELRHV